MPESWPHRMLFTRVQEAPLAKSRKDRGSPHLMHHIRVIVDEGIVREFRDDRSIPGAQQRWGYFDVGILIGVDLSGHIRHVALINAVTEPSQRGSRAWCMFYVYRKQAKSVGGWPESNRIRCPCNATNNCCLSAVTQDNNIPCAH